MLCFLDFICKGTESLPVINQVIYFVGLLFLFFIIVYIILLIFFGIFYLIDDYQELKNKVEKIDYYIEDLYDNLDSTDRLYFQLDKDVIKINKKIKKIEKGCEEK